MIHANRLQVFIVVLMPFVPGRWEQYLKQALMKLLRNTKNKLLQKTNLLHYLYEIAFCGLLTGVWIRTYEYLYQKGISLKTNLFQNESFESNQHKNIFPIALNCYH